MSEVTNNSQPVAPASTEAPSGSEVLKAAEVPVEAKPSAKEELFSSKFAQLTRKEKEILKKQKELAEYEKEYGSYKSLKEEASKNPAKVLEHYGITWDQLIEYQLSQSAPVEKDKVTILEEKLSALERAQIEKLEKEQAEISAKEQAYIDEVIQTVKSDIHKLIDSNPDKYELITANGAYDTVFEVIEEKFNSDGEVMDFAMAADLVESYFEEEAKKLINLKKLQAHAPKANEPLKDSQLSVKKTSSPTLSSNVVAHTEVSPSRPLSKQESLERAAALLKWKD